MADSRIPALPNPESSWQRSDALDTVTRAAVERRLDATGESFELLGGGLANLNVRVGSDREDRAANATSSTASARPSERTPEGTRQTFETCCRKCLEG